MDLNVFLNDRLRFAEYFFKTAAEPFLSQISDIENEKEPYVPVYDESGEPQFMQEWEDASTGFESIGLAALSMVSSSLQLYLNDWVTYRLEERGKKTYKRTHKKKGWFHAYKLIFIEVELDLDGCPADLNLIEQGVLARNRGQHPDCLTMLQTTHSESDLEKHPSPYFVSDTDSKIIENEGGERSWWLSPRVYVDEAKLLAIIEEMKKLSVWLEAQYWRENT